MPGCVPDRDPSACRLPAFDQQTTGTEISAARAFLDWSEKVRLQTAIAAPALADGDHCRDMAGKFCELARYTRSPGSPPGVVRTLALSDRWGCLNQAPEAIC